LMMEFLGGVFTGRGCSIFPGFQTGNGVLFIVLRADLFQPLEEYYATAQQLVEGVLDVPLAPGSDGVMLPGDPERRMTAARRENGIPIDDATWEQLTAAAGALGVAWQGD
ncbi:MAG: Ldh family oxidoreductase, partial [Caldilineaceae bacterium]